MQNDAAKIFTIALIIAGLATTIASQQTQPPNVIFIMADDLGYGDLGCYGQKRIQTPSLDQMAKEGIRFTDFYSGSTVCAPARCVLMTGLHTGHSWIRGNGKESLRQQDFTMAELLKKKGYATCLAGKWGLGNEGTSGYPTRKGFDEFFGYADQSHAHNYYPTFLNSGDERVQLENVVPKMGKYGQGVASVRKQYSHQLITDFAFEFVRKNRSKPFFLFWSLTIPHANNEAGKRGMEVPDFGIYSDKDWPLPQKGHAAMISLMDRDIGRLFKLLDELKIDERTLVIFTSDNGPHREGGNDPEFNDSNGPLKGIKRSLHEGGIRVPMIARWPNKIAANCKTNFVSGFQDVLPTLAEVCNAQELVPADIDGISFLPSLCGKKQEAVRELYWAFYERGGGRAIRIGKWKLIQQPYHSEPRLYDLSLDIGEQKDLAKSNSRTVEMMVSKMNALDRPSKRWKFPKKKK